MAKLVSIHRSLLVNLLRIILVLSGAILITTVFEAQQVVRSLSASVINQTMQEVEARLLRFFDPATRGLQMVRSWGNAGLLDDEDPGKLTDVFVPLMQQYPQVSSLMVADDRGREYMLLRIGEKWLNRQTRPDQWGKRTQWLEWSHHQSETREFSEELSYDPRVRPWYLEAIRKGDESAAAPHWTEPYKFFTTKDPGITASTTFDVGDGLQRVIGFDILLKDISTFTVNLEVSSNGKAFVLTDDNRIIGLPRDERFTDEENRKAALLKTPGELGSPVVADAVVALSNTTATPGGPRRFHSGGEAWWGSIRPFELTPERGLFIAVVVPESDLLSGLGTLRIWILGITVLVLGTAVWQASRMAKGYSKPIEALVRESDRISRGDLENAEPVQTRVKEVHRLAEAHNEMRDGLREKQVIRDLFGKFVPEDVAASMLHSPDGLQPHSCEATILFVDLANFTALVESVGPVEIVDILNAYFTELVNIIEEQGGVITQFQGDAILAVFNVPRPLKNHAQCGIDAAVAIQSAVAEKKFLGHQLKCRIGVNTGQVVAGNVGAGRRMNYTVHGNAVNLAARLEQLNKEHGTSVLVSENTVRQADANQVVRLGSVDVRGRSVPVTIYTV